MFEEGVVLLKSVFQDRVNNYTAGLTFGNVNIYHTKVA